MRASRSTHIGPNLHASDQPLVVCNASQSDTHNVALGVPPSFATAWLLPRFGRFKAAYPEISVTFDSGGDPFSKLGTSLDGIIVFAENIAGEFYARELRPQAAFAVCAPGYLTPDVTPVDVVKSHPLLLHKGLPKVLPLWLQAHGIDPEAKPQVQLYDSGPMLLAAAESGFGVALTLADSVRFYPGEARLERPFGEAVRTPYSYFFVCRQSALRGRALRRLHDWLADEAVADTKKNGPGV